MHKIFCDMSRVLARCAELLLTRQGVKREALSGFHVERRAQRTAFAYPAVLIANRPRDVLSGGQRRRSNRSGIRDKADDSRRNGVAVVESIDVGIGPSLSVAGFFGSVAFGCVPTGSFNANVIAGP